MKEITVKIRGETEDDLSLALLEVLKKVREGFTNGMDRNETGSYNFMVTDSERNLTVQLDSSVI